MEISINTYNHDGYSSLHRYNILSMNNSLEFWKEILILKTCLNVYVIFSRLSVFLEYLFVLKKCFKVWLLLFISIIIIYIYTSI